MFGHSYGTLTHCTHTLHFYTISVSHSLLYCRLWKALNLSSPGQTSSNHTCMRWRCFFPTVADATASSRYVSCRTQSYQPLGTTWFWSSEGEVWLGNYIFVLWIKYSVNMYPYFYYHKVYWLLDSFSDESLGNVEFFHDGHDGLKFCSRLRNWNQICDGSF